MLACLISNCSSEDRKGRLDSDCSPLSSDSVWGMDIFPIPNVQVLPNLALHDKSSENLAAHLPGTKYQLYVVHDKYK